MGRSVFSIYCKVKMLRSFSIEILIVIVAFGSTNGMKWWKSTLAETNQIVKEIQGSLSSSNCVEECSGQGFDIATCGNATQYCPECEGKYCLSYNTSSYEEYYNPVNGFEFYVYTDEYDYYDYDYCYMDYYVCDGNMYWLVWDMEGSDWVNVEDGCVVPTEVLRSPKENRKVDAKNELPTKTGVKKNPRKGEK